MMAGWRRAVRCMVGMLANEEWKIRCEGYTSAHRYLADGTSQDNPYAPGSDGHVWWAKGWDEREQYDGS